VYGRKGRTWRGRRKSRCRTRWGWNRERAAAGAWNRWTAASATAAGRDPPGLLVVDEARTLAFRFGLKDGDLLMVMYGVAVAMADQNGA
jgi:hypothetical protein